MAITMISLTALLGLFPHKELIGWLSLVLMMTAIGSVAFGPCGVVYVILAEVLPNSVRSLGFVIGGFASIITGTVFASKFLIIGNALGYSFLFGMIAFFACVYFVFCFFFLPETKNKSLEEIETEITVKT